MGRPSGEVTTNPHRRHAGLYAAVGTPTDTPIFARPTLSLPQPHADGARWFGARGHRIRRLGRPAA